MTNNLFGTDISKSPAFICLVAIKPLPVRGKMHGFILWNTTPFFFAHWNSTMYSCSCDRDAAFGLAALFCLLRQVRPLLCIMNNTNDRWMAFFEENLKKFHEIFLKFAAMLARARLYPRTGCIRRRLLLVFKLRAVKFKFPTWSDTEKYFVFQSDFEANSNDSWAVTCINLSRI